MFDVDQNKSVYKGLFATEQTACPKHVDTIGVRLSQLRLSQIRAFGDCWLGCHLWVSLHLDAFWQRRIDRYRTTVPFSKVLKLLVINRLTTPGAEFYIH